MRRLTLVGLIGGTLLSLLLVSCSNDPAGEDEPSPVSKALKPARAVARLAGAGSKADEGRAPQPAPKPSGKKAEDGEPGESLAFGDAEMSGEEAALQVKYEAALSEALTLLGDRKLGPALESLEAAKAVRDTEFIRAEIAKLKSRIEQDTAARKTADDIETILEQGKGAEAAQLAQSALREFGDSDMSGRLVKLRLQADALQAAQKAEDAATRSARFRAEGDAALREKNLRAAALAYEQALAVRDDFNLRKQFDEARASLDRYDELRRKAAELRRDPENLEDAVTALQDAAKAWDTLQVRQEIDEYSLALQKRRDRVAVADFEVRGDIGVPEIGKTVGEELLPHLKPRFDLVERAQVGKILEDLKVVGPPIEIEHQRELGRLAKARYLVVGSISPLGGIAVNARLVDVRSGLIVQTGKIVASRPEDLGDALAELGKQLLMNDEEKLAYDRERIKQVKVQAPPALDAPLPPPPEVLGANQAPPPAIVVDNPLPPDLGGLRLGDFQRLPAPPAEGRPLPVLVDGGAAEIRVRQRLLRVALNLGDNDFRRGRYAEAQRHFNLALSIDSGHVGIRVRVDRVRPLLPPPVVVVERPVIIVPPPRPRIAVLNFVVAGNPRVVPPYLSAWTPYYLAPYFSPAYEVVDPGEVYWYMAQMGMSLRDLVESPFARRWLGRALNVRYFVFGTIEETASFNVTTYMVDTEFGFVQGSGRIHAHNPLELKLRLAELAALTQMDPRARAIYLADQQRFDGLFLQGQRHMGNRDFTLAIKVYEDALVLRPNHVAVLAELNLARRRAQELAWEQARARAFALEQARIAEMQRRQAAVVESAASIRVRVGGVSIGFEQRRVLEQQRLVAQTQIVKEARLQLKIGNVQIGLSRLESAVALAPADDGLVRELALARAEAERAGAARAAKEAAARQAALRRQKEEELARARRELEVEQLRRRAAEQVAKKTTEKFDQAAYQAAFDEGRRLMSKGNYDAAVVSLSAAARIRRTAEVETLLNQALVENARASAAKKGEAARKDLERQLAEEKTLRAKAETEAKRNQELYADALKLAQKSLAAKDYTVARAKFEAAGKIYRTDAVLTGMRQADTEEAKAAAEAKATKQKAIDDQEKTDRIRRLLTEGKTALDGKQYDAALKSLRQAKSLAPDNVDVLTALTRAEQAQEQSRAEARRLAQEKDRQDNFRRLLDSGKANLANKQYDAAKIALTQALALKPGDADASAALKTAEKALADVAVDAKTKEENRKKAELFEKHMDAGRLALSTKRYEDAVKSFSAAQKVLPGDKTSEDFLRQTQKAWTEAKTAQAGEQKRQADFNRLVKDAQADIKAKRYAEAQKTFTAALKLIPNDPAAQQGLQDATRALDGGRADEQKRQADFNRLVKDAQADMKAKRYAEAQKTYTAALKLVPSDPAAQQGLQDATRALDAGRADEQKRQAEFNRLVKDAQADLKAKRYAEAQKTFTAALKLIPNDTTAQQGLQDATRALEASRKTPPPPPQPPPKGDPQAQYQKEMQNGAALEKEKKYTEAIKAYEEALKLRPKDDKASEALRGAEFNYRLVEGRTHLEARRFQAAVREFEVALRLRPGDPTATALLKKAKAGKG